MMRDEGPFALQDATQGKSSEVDSLKKLSSSGTDPKFQGSLSIPLIFDRKPWRKGQMKRRSR